VEAVGIAETFEMATEIVRPGGHVANVGVHGKPAQLRLQDLWIHNITISMGLVNTNSTPMLLKLIEQGRLQVDKFASHHFRLHDMLAAYDTFSRAAETKALKVIIDR
jgi:alcohol dehydrogenase